MSPGPESLLPILLAVTLTLWTRQVVLSLGLAVLCATLLLEGGDPAAAVVRAVDPFLLDAFADRDHAKVMLFSLFIAATVRLSGESGGTAALVGMVSRLARGRRSGMAAAWLAGMLVFFDDYANCLVVGSAMRPLTDRLRISREKLAYIVDSTAAPLATVALISTWIGYEVGLMDAALQARGIEGSAYAFFLAGLPWRFYPLLTLAFTLLIALSGRDFGPMRAAEERALGSLEPPPPAELHPARALLALLPIAALVGVTAASLWRQGVARAGADAPLFQIIGGADGYDAMLQGSTASLALALLLSTLAFRDRGARAADHALRGMGELFEALVVLGLAWTLGAAIGELGTAEWFLGALGGSLPLWSLPALTFLVSAGISFATGTSFGTMAVVMPLLLPMSFELAPFATVAEAGPIPLAVGAAVLSGSVWGDHCSPISDTTVLSSTGTGCDHAAHVRTQLPYAVAAGLVALLCGHLPAGLGLDPWLLNGLGLLGCAATVGLLGRPPRPAPPPPREARGA